jgi:hypothetical protein
MLQFYYVGACFSSLSFDKMAGATQDAISSESLEHWNGSFGKITLHKITVLNRIKPCSLVDN